MAVTRISNQIKLAERVSKRRLVKILGFVLPGLPEKPKFNGPLNSIAILAQEKLGDAILLTPLIGILKNKLPDLEVHVIAFSGVAEFFAGDPNITQVYQAKGHYASYFKKILSRKFDVLFCTKDHPSFTFLYQSRLIRARHRVGIAHRNHDGFFHHMIELDFSRHVVEKNCAILSYLDVKYAPEESRPYIPDSEISHSLRDFLSAGLDKGETIGINLSAGDKDREWPLEKYMDLLDKIRMPSVILAMPGRKSDKDTLEESFDHVIPSPMTHTVFEAGEIIRRLRFLLTPDTALVHVASCYETPVVALYRKDVVHHDRFSPYRIPHRKIISPTSVVRDITVESIVEGINQIMELGVGNGG